MKNHYSKTFMYKFVIALAILFSVGIASNQLFAQSGNNAVVHPDLVIRIAENCDVNLPLTVDFSAISFNNTEEKQALIGSMNNNLLTFSFDAATGEVSLTLSPYDAHILETYSISDWNSYFKELSAGYLTTYNYVHK